MLDNKKLRTQLEALILEDAAFQQIEQQLQVFCPFDAIGMVNAEIRHSNFLATVLNPYRPHGFGDEVLRQFLYCILSQLPPQEGISRLALHLADLDQADVRREWNRIDLLIELPEIRLVVAFELKIHAEESKGQLERYRRIIDEEWPTASDRPWRHLLLFLTRDGQPPSDEHWHGISYDLVIETIDAVLKRETSGAPLARNMLAAYSEMLKRRHMQDKELAQIAQSLWQRHPEALNFLMSQRPDESGGLGELIQAHLAEVAQTASTAKIAIEPNEDASRTTSRFFVTSWDAFPAMKLGSGWTSTNRLILIEIYCERTQVTAMLLLGPGPASLREAIFNAIQPKLAKNQKKLSDKWTRLATAKLLQKSDLGENFEQDRAFKKLKGNLLRFVQDEVSRFDEPMKSILSQQSEPATA